MPNKEDEVVAFGMTKKQIAETAETLAQQTDSNHPANTGAYTDFLDTLKKGSEMLKKQGNYCKKPQ